MISCISRYELSAKVAWIIYDHDLPSDIFLKKRYALHQDNLLRSDVDFVVSQKLTTQGVGYQSLHKWIDRPVRPVKPKPCKLKLSEMWRKIYEKHSGTKVSDSRVSFTSTLHPSKRITKTQKDVDSDLQPYYEFFTKNDVIFSQINPCFPGLSRNNVTNLVTNTAYSSILCKWSSKSWQHYR